MMRKSALLVGGAVATGLAAAVLSGFTGTATEQAPADPAAQSAAPAYTIAAGDSARSPSTI
jgi:hypothetical protein